MQTVLQIFYPVVHQKVSSYTLTVLAQMLSFTFKYLNVIE